MPYPSRSLSVLLAFIALSGSLNANMAISAEARNVILIIGDGFDDQHVTMARNYLSGNGGMLLLDEQPIRAAVQIETVSTDGIPLYVADSANTATTLATGVVTNMGRIGTGPDDEDVTTIAEMAVAAGYRAGIVSSASITDATPASFMAHVAHRGCENPEIILGGTFYGVKFEGCPQDALDNNGPGSIAEQIVQSSMHVILGGGMKHFEKEISGSEQNLLAMAKMQGFAVVTTTEALTEAETDIRLIGLFSSSHLPVRLQGTDGRTAESANTSMLNAVNDMLGSVTQPDPMACEPNPEYGATPPLAMLTESAIKHLAADNDKGFFLMVESASIDKQSHERNPCGSIGEVAQLEETLAVALAYANAHANTLVIVTADHAQAAQIIPEPSLFDRLPIPVYSPGKVARIKTPEGGLMRINYATNNISNAEHSGANVPLFANKVGADWVKPFMRQRDVFKLMANYLELKH